MILANFHDFMRSMNKESPIYANFSLKIWIIVNNKQNILGKESFVHTTKIGLNLSNSEIL